jgi:hypothetical protein
MTSGESLLRGNCTKPLLGLHQRIAPCDFFTTGIICLDFYVFDREIWNALLVCMCG